MIKIREISIISESIKQTFTGILNYLNGSFKITQTQRGYIFGNTNFLDFQTEIKKIKATIGAPPQYKEQEITPPLANTTNDKYKTLLNLYDDVYKQVDENLKNFKIPILDNPTMQNAAKIAFANDPDVPRTNEGDIPYINRDMFKKIMRAGRENQEGFKLASSEKNILTDGTITMEQSCPNGNSDCFQKIEGSIGEIMGKFLHNTTICLLESLFNTIIYILLKAYTDFGTTIRTNSSGTFVDKLKNVLSNSLGVGIAMSIPGIGPYVTLLVMCLFIDQWYYFVAKIFCDFSIKIGITTDKSYKNTCILCLSNINNNIIYKIRDNTTGEIRYVHRDGYSNNEFIYYDSNDIKHTVSNSTILDRITYNPYAKTPKYTYESIFNKNGDARNEKDRSYIIETDTKGDPKFIGYENPSFTQCAQATSLLWLLLQYNMVDIVLNPEAYGIDDPVSLISLMFIEEDLDNIGAIGALLKHADPDNKIANEMKSLYFKLGRKYNEAADIVNKMKDQALELTLIPREKLEEYAQSHNNMFGMLSDVLIDSYMSIYESLKEIVTPAKMHEVVCCLIGELLDRAIERIKAKFGTDVNINADMIIEELRKILDELIKIIDIVIRLFGADYIKIITMIMQRSADIVLQMVAGILGQLYMAIQAVIDNFIDKFIYTKSGNFYNCLPWTLVLDSLARMIKKLIDRFLQFFNTFIGKLKLSLDFGESITSRLGMLTILYDIKNILIAIRADLSLFRICISVNPNTETTLPNFGPVDDIKISIPDYQKVVTTSNMRDFITESQNENNRNIIIGRLVALKASKTANMTISVDKQKFSEYLEKITKGDPIAIKEFVEGKKDYESFEERLCSSDHYNTLYDLIQKYYNQNVR